MFVIVVYTVFGFRSEPDHRELFRVLNEYYLPYLQPQIEASDVSRKRIANTVDFVQPEEKLWLNEQVEPKQSKY